MKLCLLLSSIVVATACGCVAARHTDVRDGPEDAAVAARSLSQSLRLALATFDGSGSVPPPVLISELEHAESTATGAEREMIAATLPLLRRYASTPASISPQDLRLAAQTMARLAEIYPRDLDLQLATAAGIERIANGSAGGVPVDTGTGSARARAERLVRAFPNAAAAHAHLARLLADEGRVLPALRAYARCRELDARHKPCAVAFAALAEEWRRPRCASFKDASFGGYAAYEQAASGRRRIAYGDKTLYMEPTAALSGRHLQEVVASLPPSSATTSSATSPPAPTPDSSSSIALVLTPSGAGRLSELTRVLAESDGYLVIRIGKQRVAAPRVMSGIDSGQITLATDRPVRWRDLCARVETRRLPPDLATPASRLRPRPVH